MDLIDFINRVIYNLLEVHPIHTLVVHFPIGLTGLMDNAAIYDGQAPNASLKIVLGTLLFIVTTSTAFLRWRKPQLIHSRARGLYIGTYFLSFMIAAVLGFLGGVILYGF